MKRLGCLLSLAMYLCAAGQSAKPNARQAHLPSKVRPGGPARIAGTVLNSVTGEPLEGVHIMLVSLGANQRPSSAYGAMSDAAGHFSIQRLPAANYIIALERRGFIRVPGKGAVALGLSVELKSGEQLQDVTLEMAPRPVIAGRVLDEYGDPAMGVYVNVLPLAPQDMAGFFRQQVMTDDRGEFRITVPPGKYYLRTQNSFSSQGPPEIRSDGTVESDYLETYYPAATATDEATPVEAKPGRELNGLEIRLARSPVLSISGTVAGIPEGATSVSLGVEWGADRSEIRSSRFSSWSVSSRAALTDKFQLGHLAPGFYRIYAHCSCGGQEWQSPTAEISLVDSKIEDVQLTLAPGSEVTGTVEWAPALATPAVKAGKSTIKLQPVGLLGATRARSADAGADGAFTLKAVFADRYRVLAEPMPENGYVKAVWLNGTPAPEGILDFTNGAEGAHVKIVLSARGGQISGNVEDEKGIARWPSGTVVLFPDGDQVPEFDQVRSEDPGTDGIYKFHGLPPGKYRLLAIPHGWGLNLSWHKEVNHAIQQYGRTAQRVEIKEGDNISRDVKMSVEGQGETKKDETRK